MLHVSLAGDFPTEFHENSKLIINELSSSFQFVLF